MDDGLVAVENILPVAARKLRFEMDHGPEGSSATELGRCPGVPVAYGGEWAVEVALIHSPWYAWIARTGGVGPIPEKTALFDNHCRYSYDCVVRESLASRMERQVRAQVIAIIRTGILTLFPERSRQDVKKRARCEEKDNGSYSISSNKERILHVRLK